MSQYVYGPVHSRRLGQSLGVDLVPHKTCTFNCLYCQLGPTDETIVQRAEYVPVDVVVEAVRERLAEIPPPDYVTLGGSGEPTLHSAFGEVARRIRELTDVPLCLISNASLFDRPEVRASCRPIDLIIPSLDAPDEKTFRLINRPHPDITFDRVVDGLERLRHEFDGMIWLELFLLSGVNDADEQVEKFQTLIDRIAPDRVQLNTTARPPAEESAQAVSAERLSAIQSQLGPRAEIVARPATAPADTNVRVDEGQLVDMLRRRPCTVEDISSGLGFHQHEVVKCVQRLVDEGIIQASREGDGVYYRVDEVAFRIINA